MAEAALLAIEGGPATLAPDEIEDPLAYLIEYEDGLSCAVLMLGDNGFVHTFAYAEAQMGGSINSLEYVLESGPSHGLFGYRGLNIEEFLITGVVLSPLGRTYLTTGILEAAMRSRANNGQQLMTPHLRIRYTAADTSPLRPDRIHPGEGSLQEIPLPKAGSTKAATSTPTRRDGTVRGRRP